jgi:hypothetical protein
MQEHRVTVAERRTDRRAVLVLATQNPLEMEGTYPRPEAQLIASSSSMSFLARGAALDLGRTTSGRSTVSRSFRATGHSCDWRGRPVARHAGFRVRVPKQQQKRLTPRPLSASSVFAPRAVQRAFLAAKIKPSSRALRGDRRRAQGVFRAASRAAPQRRGRRVKPDQVIEDLGQDPGGQDLMRDETLTVRDVLRRAPADR